MVDPYAWSISWLERLTSGDRWKLKCTAILFALSLFFHFPYYNYLAGHVRGTEINPRWAAFEAQCEHPFTPAQHRAGTHQEKIALRLTVPCLAKVLHLSVTAVYLLQALLGLLMVAGSLAFCERLARDRVMALLFTGGLVFTYAGSAAFFDVWGLLDAFGYFFLFAAIFSRRPAAIALSLFLGGFTDERVLIATPLVLLFHLSGFGNDAQIAARMRLNGRVLATVGAVLACLAARYAIGHTFGLSTGTGNIGIRTFFLELGQTAWGLWSGFEGQWLLVAAFFFALWAMRERALLIAWLFAFALVCGAAVMVWDITRSAAYGFVILFAAFALLRRNMEAGKLRVLLFFACVVSLIHPMYFTFGQSRLIPVDPLFIRALHFLKPYVLG